MMDDDDDDDDDCQYYRPYYCLVDDYERLYRHDD